jgi:hypothetical protein
MVKHTKPHHSETSTNSHTQHTSAASSPSAHDMSSTSTMTGHHHQANLANIPAFGYHAVQSHARTLPPLHATYPDRAQHEFAVHHNTTYSRDTSADRSASISRTTRPMAVSSLLASPRLPLAEPTRQHPQQAELASWVERHYQNNSPMSNTLSKPQTA